jgi:hypothetical protein
VKNFYHRNPIDFSPGSLIRQKISEALSILVCFGDIVYGKKSLFMFFQLGEESLMERLISLGVDDVTVALGPFDKKPFEACLEGGMTKLLKFCLSDSFPKLLNDASHRSA